MGTKFKALLTIGSGVLASVFATASTYAATVTGSGLVTLTPADTTSLQTGMANMAASFLTVALQILPYAIPIIAVVLIFSVVKGLTIRR